jgi:hypothetical protein
MGAAVESIVFPLDSKPYGVTYPEWITRWWRWLLSFPIDKNPAIDQTGMYSSQKQEHPNVWFLAGTFGGYVRRKCQIPFGKAILMPIINYECSFADEPAITTDAQLELKCKSEIDDIKDLSVIVDDHLLSDISLYRIRSPFFVIDLLENNVLGVKPTRTRMISDGFWIFLKPFGIGIHRIITSGSCRSGTIRIGNTYDLNVL